MKHCKMIIPVLGLLVVTATTGCKSKAGSWSQEQKSKWTAGCMKLMTDRGANQKDATSLCDCMLKKTSDKYTPDEAVKITPSEERQLWQECDYQW